MLILTRRADEAILIGDNIEILVMDIKGTQVRIGVTAPRDVSVDRKEVAERKAKEAAEAAGNQWQWPAAGFRKAEPAGEVRMLRPGVDYDADAVCPGCGCFRDKCACDLRDASTSAREATK